VIAVSGSMNVGSRAVANDLYSPNSEATVGYVQTGSPQPSGFAMNVGVRCLYCFWSLLLLLMMMMMMMMMVPSRETDCLPVKILLPD